MTLPFQLTVTCRCFSDAWITRTRAWPAGVVRSSWTTWRRRPVTGPTAAAVYASPALTQVLADSTDALVAGPPAGRIAML
jgi:hypothetical protein